MPCAKGQKRPGVPWCFTHDDHPDGEACLRSRIAELEAALRPFADSHPAECVGEDGWTTTVHREPISTWFGPSDFRAARAAMKL